MTSDIQALCAAHSSRMKHRVLEPGIVTPADTSIALAAVLSALIANQKKGK